MIKAFFLLAFVFILITGQVAYVFAQGFEISQLVIKSAVKRGDSINNPVNIINLDKAKEFSISYASEKEFISIDKDNFILDENGEETIDVKLESSRLGFGVYTGQVSIESEEEKHVIPVILEVESADVLFDSFLEIAPRFSKISPGSELEVNVKIVNLKSSTGNVDVRYFIKDTHGNLIASDYESLSVANQVEFSRSFTLPEGLEEGDYVFAVYTGEAGSFGTSSALFSILNEPSLSPLSSDKIGNYYLLVSFGVIVVLIGAFLALNYYWNRRVLDTAKNWNRKLVDLRKVKLEDVGSKIKELEYKKALLGKALERGYITKSSFEDGRRKINEVVAKLKKRL